VDPEASGGLGATNTDAGTCVARPDRPRKLATELRERFRDGIGKTAELIGRDLSLRLDR